MKKQCILVIEDDVEINNSICAFLKNDGYVVLSSIDGQTGLEKFYNHEIDLLVLDLMLPSLGGEKILSEIREVSSVPVIVISALNDLEIQKNIFTLADDFVVKPFPVQILLYKIQALLRRVYGNVAEYLSFADLLLDLNRSQVLKGDESISLTERECEILKILFSNPKKIYNRSQIVTLVWGYNYFGDDRVVDVHIKNIRKKLGNGLVKTIIGRGYTLEG
ncbi:response regulator transcription factor [Culicoidibacter larvae]|nr:response regulator transcription factor [Culicoidibacter larvae]